MTVLTIKKNEDGSESYEIDDKIIELFKDQPSDLKGLIDSLKQKEVKLSQEETNRKKEETSQKKTEGKKESIKDVCNTINMVVKAISEAYEFPSSEDNLVDTRSDEEVESDVNKNYTFMNSEIKI